MLLDSCWLPAALACWLGLGSLGFSQENAASSPDAKASGPEPRSAQSEGAAVQQCEFGMVFKAQGGIFKDLVGTVTVPADWPNQQRVRVVKEELPPGATVTYRTIPDVGRQMSVKIPAVRSGQEARAVVTFEVEVLTPPAPVQDTSQFRAPDPHKVGRRMAAHLAPSPQIESNCPEVRKAAKEAVGERIAAWEQVQAIHQWVRKNIASAGGLENVQTCIQTLQLRRGVCAEINSLTVAMLRAAGFPARLVRVPKHCYYEVYLLDGDGQGQWLSGDASAADTITPGSLPGGVILQKGDNVPIVDPNTKRRIQGRFLGETATGVAPNRAARLQFQPISPAQKETPRTSPP